MGDGFDEVRTREEFVHHSELAAALEAYRDTDITGKIVGAEYPSDNHAQVKLTWVWAE